MKKEWHHAASLLSVISTIHFSVFFIIDFFLTHAKSLSSTDVLSKLTVLHHSSLNCLRRMGAILATSIFFGVPMSTATISGLCTSFVGFSAFTYFRRVRLQQQHQSANNHHKNKNNNNKILHRNSPKKNIP
jgi:hypothetical protein